MLQLRTLLILALVTGCAAVQRRPEPLDLGGGSPAGLWMPPSGVYLGQAGQSTGNDASFQNLTILGTLAVTGATSLSTLTATTGAFTGNVTAGTTNTYDLGTTSLTWRFLMLSSGVADSTGTTRYGVTSSASANTIQGAIANSGTASANIVKSKNALSGGTGILEGHSDTTAAAYEFKFHNSGKLMEATTDSTGTPGNATITTPTGQFSIGAGAGLTPPIVITSNTDVVTTASIIHAVLQTADATCVGVTSVVPGAGSFTVTTNADCTGTTNVGFIVFN
jgi:hypothetical protein